MKNDALLNKIRERLAGSQHAARTEDIMNVLRGAEPLRHGMPVQVERAAKDQRAPNGEAYHVKIRASTESIARDAGIIPISAWEKGGLKNFNANPVVLAYHSQRDPVGISVHTEIDGDQLVEYWRFHEETDLSRTMKTLYEKGYMRAASVGFLVTEFRFVDELNDEEAAKLTDKYGKAALKNIYWIAQRAELLETSAVPVPSDPSALVFSHAVRNAEAVGIELRGMDTFLAAFHRSTDMKTEQTPATGATPTAEETERAAQAERNYNELVTRVADAVATKLTERFTKLEERLTTLEKPATSTNAGSEGSAARSTEQKTAEVAIEKQAGETDEQAVTRFIDMLVAKQRGAPIPSTK